MPSPGPSGVGVPFWAKALNSGCVPSYALAPSARDDGVMRWRGLGPQLVAESCHPTRNKKKKIVFEQLCILCLLSN